MGNLTELETKCLEAFPAWLRALGDDARAVAAVLGEGQCSDSAGRRLAASLNYLFKSLDLIPDGIEDLGFVDDAFVFRVAAEAAVGADPTLSSHETIARLANDAALIREFLDADYARLVRHGEALEQGSARGRTVDAIIGDAEVRAALVREVQTWADGYQAPSFARDPKNLVKLRSFLTAKLPQ